MKNLEIAVPWNNPSYFSCNGFHPLYQAFFDDQENSGVSLTVLDEIDWARKFGSSKYLAETLGKVEQLRTRLAGKWAGHELANAFISHVSPEDFWLAATLPGDIEFHHTSPLTAGERPFVLHCESFLPIFMPFAYQGAGNIKQVLAVKSFYGSLFEDDRCLGIYSHLSETLDQISRFFGSAIIDAKLQKTGAALAKSVFTHLDSDRKTTSGPPCFLFTSSANQQPTAFKLRGGFSALEFALRYFDEGREGLFVFRCAKPANADLKLYGLNMDLLAAAEARQHVLWIEGFLPEKEQLALFRCADFFLLPSINLHSVSIMQAQLAGAIPIVTDTLGTDEFVEDATTGIMLEGVRDALWTLDTNTGILVDNHRLWTKELAGQLCMAMFQRVAELLDNPGRMAALRQHMMAYARMAYSGEQLRSEFFTSLGGRAAAIGSSSRQASVKAELPLLEMATANISRLFASPSVPNKILVLEQSDILHAKGIYWSCTSGLDLGAPANWSPLLLAKNGVLKSQNVLMAATLGDLAGRLLPMEGKTNPVYQLQTDIRRWAMQYPWLKAMLKKLFLLSKPIVMMIEKLIVSQDESLSISRSFLVGALLKIPFAGNVGKKAYLALRSTMRRFRVLRSVASVLRFIRNLLSVLISLVLALGKLLLKRVKESLLLKMTQVKKRNEL